MNALHKITDRFGKPALVSHRIERMGLGPAMAVSALFHLLVFILLSPALKGPVVGNRNSPAVVKLLEPYRAAPEVPPTAPPSPRVTRQRKPPSPETSTRVKRRPSLKEPAVPEAKGPPQGTRESQKIPVPPVSKTGPKTPPLPENLGLKQLLPGDLIARAARKPLQHAGTPQRPPGITFSTKDLKYEPYMQRLKERIEAIWVYPQEAVEKGIYGDLVIEFAIRKDGSLAYARVVRTSGFDILDEAALRALKQGQPYWPLPNSWGKDILRIQGHFIYTLTGMYIR